MSFTEQDYQTAADKLGVPIAAVKAVAEVESGGATQTDLGPIIRLEAHWFGKLTGYRYNESHPQISSTAWNPSLAAGNQFGAWQQFTEAAALDRNAAIQSCSWGAFQIMGFHWKALGYATPDEMVDAMQTDGGQLDSFVRFIQANPLLEDAMRRQDWSAFAAGYNGTGQIDVYAGRIAAAYERHLSDSTEPALPPQPSPDDDAKAIQAAVGVPVDGKIGPVSLRAIRKALHA